MPTFISELSETQLVQNLPSDLDLAVNQYDSDLQSLINKHAPVKRRQTTIRPCSPWFNDHLRDMKKEKRRWERKWQSSGLEVHRQIYKQRAGEYYTAINEAKKVYYFDKISSSTQTQLFRLIDSLFTVKDKTTLPTHSNQRKLASEFCTSSRGRPLIFLTRWNHLGMCILLVTMFSM